MGWQQDSNGSISYAHALESGVKISFKAESIRRERTGVHARITIAQDGFALGYDTFNVERERERTHLANSAFSKLGKAEMQQCPKRVFGSLLDAFCLDFYPEWMRQYEPEEVAGDVNVGPPEFVLEPWVLRGGGTILFAPPGQGKSTVGFLMAQSMNTGRSTLWHCGKPSKVLYINLERDKRSIQRRLVHVNNVLGLESIAKLLMLNARGRALSDVMDAIERKVQDGGVDVVLLDSITRAGYGDLTLNEPANQIMDALNGVCETWVAVAHTPRGDGTHAFGCHDDATEVLTRKGWVRFPDWRGEAVLTLDRRGNRDNFAYVRPTAYHEYDYAGPMVEFDSPSLNASVTPNHGLFIWDKQGRKRWVRADQVPAESRLPFARAVQTSAHQIPSVLGFPIEPLARLVGIVVSEGSFSPGVIQIAQASKNSGFIRRTLDELGLSYKKYEYEPTRKKDTERMAYFAVKNCVPLLQWMRRNCGKGAANKRLPANWRRWPVAAQKELFEALMWGDGWWLRQDHKYGVYTTISRQLADDVQALALTLGLGASVSHDSAYRVQTWRGRPWRWLIRKRHIRERQYTGKVYCFTMPTGFLVTRRHGRTAVMGNSQMFDAAADMTVQLLSQHKEDGTLGIGLQCRKANDVAFPKMEVWAAEYDEYGMKAFRRAKPGEFSEIEAGKNISLADEIAQFLMEGSEPLSATDLADELDRNRSNVSSVLSRDRRFVRAGRDGHSILYAVESVAQNG